jgi:hypothetical protein
MLSLNLSVMAVHCPFSAWPWAHKVKLPSECKINHFWGFSKCDGIGKTNITKRAFVLFLKLGKVG